MDVKYDERTFLLFPEETGNFCFPSVECRARGRIARERKELGRGERESPTAAAFTAKDFIEACGNERETAGAYDYKQKLKKGLFNSRRNLLCQSFPGDQISTEGKMEDIRLQHRVVESGGLNIHYVEYGDPKGPLVLLLHGFPCTWQMWYRQMEPLAEAGFHVVLPDLRGYGFSGKPSDMESYSRKAVVGDILTLIEKCGNGEPVGLVGHDLGGHVAWSVTADGKNHVTRVPTLNVPYPALFQKDFRRDLQEFLKDYYKYLFQMPQLPDFFLSRNREKFLNQVFQKDSVHPHPEDVYERSSLDPRSFEGCRDMWSVLDNLSPGLPSGLTRGPPKEDFLHPVLNLSALDIPDFPDIEPHYGNEELLAESISDASWEQILTPGSPSSPVASSNSGVSASTPQSPNSLYKTELCRSWEETGSCRYGAKCQFAHGQEELRVVARHPRYKTEICRTFNTNGTCPYGTRCRFIHRASKTKSPSTPNIAPAYIVASPPPSPKQAISPPESSPRRLPIFQKIAPGSSPQAKKCVQSV